MDFDRSNAFAISYPLREARADLCNFSDRSEENQTSRSITRPQRVVPFLTGLRGANGTWIPMRCPRVCPLFAGSDARSKACRFGIAVPAGG